ncbi:antiviral reverse transcriptase Drt3b [Corynebacterium sp. CCM 9204]|uniref:antiviral reverse transcriptase Drt3b n=1 Tax=Corynebacterium sp. CCM 9204 TaxID=3057616 RepID=UPI0035265208
MSFNRRKVSTSWLRPILSEVFPHELPLSFDPNSFFEFFRSIDVQWNWQMINKKYDYEFTVSQNTTPWQQEISTKGFGLIFKGNTDSMGRPICSLPKACSPYRVVVPASPVKKRTLSIIHPAAMLRICAFYDYFESSMINYCNRSLFSIRKPVGVSRIVEVKEILPYHESVHDNSFSGGHEPNESTPIRKQRISSEGRYFKYVRYNWLSNFVDSEEFSRCENKYRNLIRLDVSHCFDSLYTHSISWVVNGLDCSKSYSSDLRGLPNFGDRFDELLQFINWKETNGIVVGPEVSRIFAECILQEIDLNILSSISKIKPELVYGEDYEIFRYIDDYFAFFKDPNRLSLFEDVIRRCLAEYKLSLNDSKKQIDAFPFQRNESIARGMCRELIGQYFLRPSAFDAAKSKSKPEFRINDAKVKLLLIGKIADVPLHSFINYLLGAVVNSVERFCEELKSYVQEREDSENRADIRNDWIINYFIDVLRFSFYGYGFSESYESNLKICRVLSLVLKYLEGFSDQHSATPASRIAKEVGLDRVRRIVVDELFRSVDPFGIDVRRINLIDFLVSMKRPLSEEEVEQLLRVCGERWNLDAFSLICLFRSLWPMCESCQTHGNRSRCPKDPPSVRAFFASVDNSFAKKTLCVKIREIIEGDSVESLVEATILKLALLSYPCKLVPEAFFDRYLMSDWFSTEVRDAVRGEDGFGAFCTWAIGPSFSSALERKKMRVIY